MSCCSSLNKEGKDEEIEDWKKEFVKLVEVPNITLKDELVLQLEYTHDSYTRPVFIRYYETGQAAYVEYQAHNNRNKLNGPVKTLYYENGLLCCERFNIVDKKSDDTTFNIYYGYNNQMSSVIYTIDGKVDVLSLPGLLSYFKNGQSYCDDNTDSDISRLKTLPIFDTPKYTKLIKI